ncbi:DUF1836 domain-containing protein [Bacillus sp. RG28]|uniref:DUF1836 domain-containing protein n=1 Tax=Gottfriedia endophytica TaxID=2820819 RepID=A0A940NUD3_9BACI|nr:DUF1836 domain-containing protein [Gottfriedia endophytica]MBP0726941.1 DUF1836 domain-containing protein [Gottfriedia endophytica]
MENINKLIEKMYLENKITLEDIPNVDLYVDQVVQLFENNFGQTTRNEDEKVLTKTMINNYAKGKLFFPIKNKKYSKEHIILISLIYQLKGALSINDIKSSLEEINNQIESKEDFKLDSLYKSYLQLYENNANNFRIEIEDRMKEVKEVAETSENGSNEENEKFLLLSSLVTMSNLYRRLAEKIVDEMTLTESKK